LASVFAVAPASMAADKPGTSFQHKDWQLACDNTGTCRAAGYQADGAQPAVSLLLVRKAGPKQEITAQVQLGSFDEKDSALAEGVDTLAIRVNGRNAGQVEVGGTEAGSPLSRAAVAALMPALQQASAVTFSSGKRVWTLSTAGASAVLLKMDEVQGRLGTVGAIARKGSKPEEGVVMPVVPPVVIAASVPKESAAVVLPPAQRAALFEALRKVVSADDCSGLHDADKKELDLELEVHRLSGTKSVASVVCQSYAYNQSSMFWLINATPPFAPVTAVANASSYDDGQISSAQKGRGLGDCWGSETWTWDGMRFVHTGVSTTGMCRLVTPGGAWDLPTYVTTVRTAAPGR
jgi:hypothetical protein